jgi:hypothetical protein
MVGLFLVARWNALFFFCLKTGTRMRIPLIPAPYQRLTTLTSADILYGMLPPNLRNRPPATYKSMQGVSGFPSGSTVPFRSPLYPI